MKKNIFCMICLSLIANIGYAEAIDLICSGEHQYDLKHAKTPYSFQIKIDLDSKISTVSTDYDPWLGRKASYPDDTPWSKENCPSPYWSIDVTETRFRIISACSLSFYNEHGGILWEIARANGDFKVFTHSGQEAKGLCVKKSERAF